MIKLSDLLADTGGVATGLPADHVFQVATADSRRCPAGSLFAAVRGDHDDGHRYAQMALDSGAGAVLVDEPGDWQPSIQVPDTRRALFQILSGQRRRFTGRVVAITGSVGKTTTKDLLAHLLAATFSTFATAGNLNSDVGLPIAVVALDPDQDVAVVEMAMRLPGEIAALVKAFSPDLAIITRIGVSHIGRLGSVEAIVRAKAEILGGLGRGGIAILNADDPWADYLALAAPGSVLRAGQGEPADLRLTVLEDRGLLGWRVRLAGFGSMVDADLVWPGPGALEALALAAAGAVQFGVGLEQLAHALQSLDPAACRIYVWERSGVLVIDDSYNASPQSMEGALRLLGAVSGHRRIAVLGDMRELGQHGPRLHQDVGRIAAQCVDRLIAVGDGGRAIAAGALSDGFSPADILVASDRRQAEEICRRWIKPGDAVLVKASRAVGLDGLMQAVLADD
ncbi:MAG: UDP-N-acetylmuramoyl-tripeptide--D-alanyl-D-alanine ligase [Sulfobacillus sp.]